MNSRFFRCLFLVVTVLTSTYVAQAQTNAQNVYVSATDQDLAIKSIVLIPPTDNVSGIYARPVEEELNEVLTADKQWALATMPSGLKIKSSSLEDQPLEVAKIIKATKSDAALSARVLRGTRGLTIELTLYVGKSGLPLLQETLTDYNIYEVSAVRAEVRKLFENIKGKMPYRGAILSRRGQQVTLNLGATYGLKQDSQVTVLQIIKVNRHPKHNFLVSTEKEVLGRVKLFKVEPYLSFGHIEMEKDPGVITVGSKVVPEEFVKYSLPATTSSGRVLQDVSTSPDKEVAFGEEPKAWVPVENPQFGKIELLAGVSSYSQNSTLRTAGSVTGSSNLAPNMAVNGELWLNPLWQVGFGLRQSIFSLSNSLATSSPTSLNMSMSRYEVNLGYNFLLSNDYFGPKLQLTTGFLNTNFVIDDSSPVAFTTMNYSGLLVRLAGQFPLGDFLPIDLGASFDFFLSPTLSENKTSGASSSSQLNNFGIFGEYKLRTRLKIRSELTFENYNSTFSGTGQRTDPATSTSHKLMTLLGGVQYSF